MAKPTPTARARAGRLALALASVLVSLLAAELTLRALGIAPARFAQTANLESVDKRVALDLYADDPRAYFPLDLRIESERAPFREALPEVDARFEQTPFGVPLRFGEELCRGEAIGPPDPSRPRVLVIGDSFTEGQGVREEDTFVARLGARMPDVELLDCGRRGYDFPRLREWFDLRLHEEPNVVVYAMVLNDPEQSEAFHARQQYLDDWILDRRRMFTEGHGMPPAWQPRLFALVRDRIESARVGDETTRWYREMVLAPNQEGWDRTLAHMVHMDQTMRARGGTFVVALWPLMIGLDGEYPFTSTHETIVAALEERHILVRDTLRGFTGQDPRELWVHPADRHPNERAHAIFAYDIEPTVRAAVEAAR